jgi:hypothetical protein
MGHADDGSAYRSVFESFDDDERRSPSNVAARAANGGTWPRQLGRSQSLGPGAVSSRGSSEWMD